MDETNPGGTPAASGEGVSEGAGRLADEARTLAEGGARFATSKVRAVRAIAEDKTEEVRSWVRARPIASVMIALGVGYLLGTLVRR